MNPQSKVKFSIRYKFLLVTTVLLIICVGAYLLLASSEFKNDKRTLVFDFNQSLVDNTASDLDSFFTTLSDKTRMMAFIYREPPQKRQEWIADFMHDQKDLVFVASSEQFKSLDQIFYVDQNFQDTYGLAPDFFISDLLKKRPIPFEKINLEGQVLWNATFGDGPPLIGMGRSVIEEDDKGIPIKQFAVIGFIRADRIIKNLEQGRPNEVFIALANGSLLVHPDSKKMSEAGVIDSEILERAQNQKVKRFAGEFFENGVKYLGAYSFAYGGKALVISKVAESIAFAAVNRLAFRSIIFASMIITLAFLIAIFFSRSMTRPLDKLLIGMRRVSEGDLSGQIEIQSLDEISLLAHSFNRMIHDLNVSRHELEEINRDLELKVKERTHELELQNQAVKEAQEALLRTTRLAAAGEVAGQAAHEVLNPLTSIISRLHKVQTRIQDTRSNEAKVLLDIVKSWKSDFTNGGFQKLFQIWQEPSKINPSELLWDEDLRNFDSVGKNMIEEFQSLVEDTDFLIGESERIGRIISSFRSLSTSRGELKESSLHLLCDKSLKIMADLATRDQIKISAQFLAVHDQCLVDEDEFIQVMTNLLRNSFQSIRARNYPKNVGELILRSENKGDEIWIHVIDNGLGISIENQKKLFEKNFTTKGKLEGTGIGLSISRRLMRAFHGDLKLFQSQEGQGAHFILTLPMAKNSDRKIKNRSVA